MTFFNNNTFYKNYAIKASLLNINRKKKYFIYIQIDNNMYNLCLLKSLIYREDIHIRY